MDNNYGEILCTAIDEIISTRLQGLSFDITKQCTIKDDSRAYQGRYVVSDGGSKFEAFSSDTSFKNGNSVLVTIPNGDFTMQKTIVGRIASVDTTPFKYMSPLDSMIKIENTMLKDIIIPETGLLANQMMVNGTNSTSGTMIKCFEVPESIVNSAQFKGFTRLGIQADFKTILNGLDIKEGSYGLKIYIHADKITSPGEVDKEGLWELTFSSSEMVGNPYKFATYFQQEKVFDISDVANIKKIEVYLYQNSNFKDINGNLIAHQYQSYIPTRINANTDLTEKEYYYLSNNNYIKLNTFNPNLPMTTKYFYLEEGYLPNNIFVNNFKFYLGYELERYDGETLELYPIGSTTSYHHTRQHELKRINLRWIHQDENGNISLLEKDENNNCMILPDNLTTEDFYEVRWFRYNFGHPVIDEYAKVNWERIEKYTDYILLDSELTREEFNNNKNNINYAYLNENNQYIDIIKWPDEDFAKDTQFFTKVEKNAIDEFVFAPNINLQTEKIKVVGIIRKNNGRQLDKKTIEADNVYILFSEVKSFWNAIPLLEDDKHPYQKEFFTDGGKDENDNQIYNKYDGTPTEEEELNLFIKLSYLQIVAMQNTIKPENFTDSGSSKASAQYLEAMANFVNLFPNIPAYIYEPYYSKELIFTNEEKVVDQLTYDAATALAIVCEDGSEGNYLIYDQNGKLKNEGQGEGYERNLILTFKGHNIDIAYEYLDDIDWVEWYLPSDDYDVTTSTMIKPSNFREHTSKTTFDGVDYLTFRYNKEYVSVSERYPNFNRDNFLDGKFYLQSTDDTSKYEETKKWNAEHIVDGKSIYYEYRFTQFKQPYSIRSTWLESNANNTIRVKMSINGNIYEAIEEMKFGKGGSNGTDTTFLLEFSGNANSIEFAKDKWLKVRGRLYKGLIEQGLTENDLSLDWLSWKFKDDQFTNNEQFLDIKYFKTDINEEPIYETGRPTLFIANADNTIYTPINPLDGHNEITVYNAGQVYYIRNYLTKNNKNEKFTYDQIYEWWTAVQDENSEANDKAEYFYRNDSGAWIKIPIDNWPEDITETSEFSQADYPIKNFISMDPAKEFKDYIGYNPAIRYLCFKSGIDFSNYQQYFRNNFHILQGIYNYDGIELQAYLSIPLKIQNTSDLLISHIEGTKEVNYSHQGQPSYYAGPYKIFSYSDQGYTELDSSANLWNINVTETFREYKPIDLKWFDFYFNSSNKRYFYQTSSDSPINDLAEWKSVKGMVFYKKIDDNTYEIVELTKEQFDEKTEDEKYYYLTYDSLENLTKEIYENNSNELYYYITSKNNKPNLIKEWPDGDFATDVKFFKGRYKDNEILEWIWDFSEGITYYEQDITSSSYIPSLQNTNNNKRVFSPSLYFAEGATNKICVYYSKENNYYWSQPILIYKHRYDFDVLNSWNGGLQTDEANGTIMANMLGAGRKNDDNSFSGVMIGDIRKGTNNESASTETGVYGLHHGDMSFALKDDGTATFGVAGKGQIHIDGNSSTITSQGYLDELGGLFIDLDDGIISIEETDDATAALRMTSKEKVRMINFDTNEQYLKSNSHTDSRDMKIDLGRGIIDIFGPKGSIKIQENEPYLVITGENYTKPIMYVGEEQYYLRSSNYAQKTSQVFYKNDQNEDIYYHKKTEQYVSKNSNDNRWRINSLDDNTFTVQEIYPQIEVIYYEKDNTTTPITFRVENIYQVNISNTKYYNYFDNKYYNQSNIQPDLEYENELKILQDGETTVSDNEKLQLCKDLVEARIAQFESEKGDKYYTEQKGEGLNFDLRTGKIEGYDLAIKAVSADIDTNFIQLNSSAPEYPVAVGPRFKINWDGSCYIKHLSNTFSSTEDDVQDKYAINIGNKFKVTNGGDKLYANGKNVLSLIQKAYDKAVAASQAASNAASAAATVQSNLTNFISNYNRHGHITSGTKSGGPVAVI